jgi:hypothetical protein
LEKKRKEKERMRILRETECEVVAVVRSGVCGSCDFDCGCEERGGARSEDESCDVDVTFLVSLESALLSLAAIFVEISALRREEKK